jgi:lipopolysaccharide/colanic/teichoic acid biosynthesis glycosyltransferase
MIRLFDFLFSFLGLIILLPILIILWIIGFFENGSPIFKQKRVGYNQKLFILFKFRTMLKDTKSVPTHLVNNLKVTKFGFFLRQTKLDELPQLFNVLIGDMSLVGPRPCLVNQKKLISERKKRSVFKAKPGITGLAQISGITMKNPTLLAKTDMKMVRQLNLFYYFYYIVLTFFIFFKKN